MEKSNEKNNLMSMLIYNMLSVVMVVVSLFVFNRLVLILDIIAIQIISKTQSTT